MPNIFFISDTHFGHLGVCKFLRSDGITPLRPWDNIEEMDEALVKNWNSVVKPNDSIYHLGDVVINRRFLATLDKLNGSKRLILGNHDIFNHSDYTKYFKRLHGSLKIDDFILSHIPLHPDSVPYWATANIHGHIHANDVDSPLYYNVSVENINYTPISLEDLRIQVKLKQTKYNVDRSIKDINVINSTQEN
jgi:calcineurin-like phosphoesterase family protein